jgi:hypothetical protein
MDNDEGSDYEEGMADINQSLNFNS